MSDEERRSYGNLILLCDEHHSIIDNKRNEAKYTKETILEWKEKHIENNCLNEIQVSDEVVSDALHILEKSISRIEENTDKILEKVKKIETNSSKLHLPDFNQIQKLVEDYKKEVASGEHSEFKEVYEKITHYSTNVDEIKQDLLGKLKDGGFEEDADWAIELKEEYAKKLLKNDVSLTQQKIHAFLLAKLQMAFRRHVLSAIRENESKDKIRHLVDDKVISMVGSYLGYENVLNLYEDDINGMLYFLTGNCHLKWI
ncbi:MAG: ABC-three component system protein [Bacteroidota bacterium]